MRVLIVEDEPLVRAGIRQDVEAMEGVEVGGEADSVAAAVEALESGQFEVVLLDIHLPDGTGFDVVRSVGAERMPAVVFLTAYDQYAIQAFEVNAADYVLKPYDDTRLRASLERARGRLEAGGGALVKQLEGLLAAQGTVWPRRIAVRDGERYDFVAVDSIDWVESANNYVALHCGHKDYLLRESLTSFERRLDPSRFQRVHRCHVINTERLKAAYPLPGGDFELELETGAKVRAGRQYGETLRRILRSGV